MGCVSSRPTRDGAIYAKEHTTSSASSQTTKHNDMAIALSAFSGNATPTFPGSIAQSPMLSLPPPSPGACTSAEAFRAAAPLLFSYPPPAISESLLGRKRSHDLLATRNHASAAPPFVRRTTTADGRPLGSVRSKSEETVRQARGDSTPASGMGSITGWQILAQQVGLLNKATLLVCSIMVLCRRCWRTWTSTATLQAPGRATVTPAAATVTTWLHCLPAHSEPSRTLWMCFGFFDC